MIGAVLLYSNFSKQSLRWLQIYNNSPELDLMISLKRICIDDPEIRRRIINSKTLKVVSVPCILVLQNNVISSYEGIKSFYWIQDMVSILNSEKHKAELDNISDNFNSNFTVPTQPSTKTPSQGHTSLDSILTSEPIIHGKVLGEDIPTEMDILDEDALRYASTSIIQDPTPSEAKGSNEVKRRTKQLKSLSQEMIEEREAEEKRLENEKKSQFSGDQLHEKEDKKRIQRIV
jgi:hypothetical protein